MPKRSRLTVAFDRAENGWVVKGSGEDGEAYGNKRDAVKRAAEIGRQRGNAQLIIKGRDGRIQSERTYGGDPRRTKG